MSDSEPQAQQGGVGAVINAIKILRHVAGTSAQQGVTTIARETGISASTSFNILRTLVKERFVSFDTTTKTYSIGLACSELAIALIGISPDELVRPELQRLAEDHRMLIAFWRFTDDDHFILAQRAFVASAVRVEMPQGLRLPLGVGAVGRSAFAAEGIASPELKRHFKTLRWSRAPNQTEYLRSVRLAADLGYAIDEGNMYSGVTTVAVSILDLDGRARFAISGTTISGQRSKEDLECLAGDLKEAAQIIGRSIFVRRD